MYNNMDKVEFEWDDRKNRLNIDKHGVNFEFAQRAFLDRKRVIVKDKKHSQAEERYHCIGRVNSEIVTVRFTYRKKRIRIIGDGYWRQGKKIYDQENQVHQ